MCIAHEIADAEEPGDRAVGGVVEPLGGDLDESGPADRLRQAVAEPRGGEDRETAGSGEQQREHRRAADADQKIAPSTPVVAEPGEEQLAECVGTNAE